MSLVDRFFTSLTEKGPRITAGLVLRRLSSIFSKIGDRGFDLRYGTDTLNLIELEDLDIESPTKLNGMRYEPTRARPMRRSNSSSAVSTSSCPLPGQADSWKTCTSRWGNGIEIFSASKRSFTARITSNFTAQ